MTGSMSRRELLARVAVATAAAAAGAVTSVSAASADGAAGPPRLSPTDPSAVALAYVEDAALVDPSKFKSYRPGQSCANCTQIQGAANVEWRPCVLFPNKLVKAAGWCSAYVG